MRACGRSKRSQARDYLAHSFARAWPESVQHEKSNRHKNRSRGHRLRSRILTGARERERAAHNCSFIGMVNHSRILSVKGRAFQAS